MVKVYENGNIVATKGDTIKTRIVVTNDDDTVYEVNSSDVINFGLKKDYTDESCLIEKTIDNTTLELILEHDDTKELAVGLYKYDIQITKADGTVNTFKSGTIKITEEVYDK